MDLKDALATPFLSELNFSRNIRFPNSRALLKLLGSRDLKTMMEATYTAEREVSGIQDALSGADRCEPTGGGESGETASPVLEYFEREVNQIAESAHYLIELMSKERNNGSSPSVDSETPSIVSELAHLKDFEDSMHMEMEEAEEDFSTKQRNDGSSPSVNSETPSIVSELAHLKDFEDSVHMEMEEAGEDFSTTNGQTVPPIISVCSTYFRGASASQDYECNDDLMGFSLTRERKPEPFEKNGGCHPCSRLGANCSPHIMPGFSVARCESSQLPPDISSSGVQRVIRLPIMTSSKISGSATKNSDSGANEELEIFRVVRTPVLVSFSSLESWENSHKLNNRSEPPVLESMFDPLLNIPGFLVRDNAFCPNSPTKVKACSCAHHCQCGRSDEETIDTVTESSSSDFSY